MRSPLRTFVIVVVLFLLLPNGALAERQRVIRAEVRTRGSAPVRATVGTTPTGIEVRARVGGGTRPPGTGTSSPTRARRTFQIVCYTPRSTTPPAASLTHREEWGEVEVIDIDGTTRIETRYLRTWQEFRLPCNGGTYQVVRCVLGDCPETPPVDPPPPDPLDVAHEAIERADWELPRPVFSPDHRGDDDLILVGLPFFWAVDPDQWHDITGIATACNGISCTTATITATPTILRFDPGTGDAPIDTCQRPGTIVRTADMADAEPDDCQLIFQDRGRYQASITIHYEVAYQSTDTNGATSSGVVAEGHDSTTTASLLVKEAQAVITG